VRLVIYHCFAQTAISDQELLRARANSSLYMHVSNKTAKCETHTNTSIQTYLRSWTIDVRLVHLNGIMFQSEHVVRKNNGFVTTPLMISYQILCASELAGVHDIQKLQDIIENLVQHRHITKIG
jgi:hypothetical protein